MQAWTQRKQHRLFSIKNVWRQRHHRQQQECYYTSMFNISFLRIYYSSICSCDENGESISYGFYESSLTKTSSNTFDKGILINFFLTTVVFIRFLSASLCLFHSRSFSVNRHVGVKKKTIDIFYICMWLFWKKKETNHR